MTKEQEQKVMAYVQKYAIQHHISIEEAKQALMCKYYEEYVVKSNNLEVPNGDKV